MQVSMVWVCPSVRCRAMILRCRAVRCGRCPLSPASSVRWLPLVAVLFLAGFNGSGVSPLYCFPLQVRAVVAMVKFSHLTNFVLNKKLGCIIQNCSLGGCPLSPASSARWFPLVGGSFLAGFNGLGVSLVAVLFPSRCQWFGCVPSVRCRAVSPIPASSARWLPVVGGSIPLQGSMVRVCHWWGFYSLAGVNGSGVSPR